MMIFLTWWLCTFLSLYFRGFGQDVWSAWECWCV